jgi:polyisoprenoid-binding protein YceI
MLQEVLHAGTHEVGPANATLSVHTERGGAAAKAGHDLLIRVTSWQGKIVVGESPDDVSLELGVDPTSLRVQGGHGGMTQLDEADLENIHKTIDDEVLRRRDIAFRSTGTAVDGDVIHVDGDLTLFGNAHPVSFDLRVGEDGALSGAAVLRQTDWGMKPYSALFGALKVADEVRVELDGHLAS